MNKPHGGDHPRSRGVYIKKMGAAHPTEGSSPLARGLPLLTFLSILSNRIIPARAGFTMYFRGTQVARGDHPRSRGVYAKKGHLLTREFGSSPLARGLQ